MRGAIIDSHVHHYSEGVFGNPGLWADEYGEGHWKELVLGEEGLPSLQGWASTEKLIGDMDEAGINKVVLQGWYWEHQETCNWQNEFYLECARKYPERLILFVCVQPRDGDWVLDDLKRAVDGGVRGIGEVFPAAQGFGMTDPVWLKVVEFAIEKNLPITMHVTEPAGHDYKGRVEAPLMDYVWLAKTYPELKLILAHWGGLLPFYEFNPYLKKVLKNVYYDTAASPLLYDQGIYRAVIDAVGAEKVLFGSDYPLRVFPKIQKDASFVESVKAVEGAGLTDEELEHVMGGNLKKLLR